MDRIRKMVVFALVLGVCGTGFAESLVLKADRDNFGRSNKRNRNNGASEHLVVAHAGNIRSIIAFDLSSVTNEIIGAEFRFHQQGEMPERISLVVAPMVNAGDNHKWKEGSGNLGVQGQNSNPGESCYSFRAFPDQPWESTASEAVADLSDPALWLEPIATLNGLRWEDDRWIRVPITDSALLEKIRKSNRPTLTLGLWGKAGNGLYLISSGNSEWVPELHLDLKEGGGNENVSRNKTR